MAYSMTVRLLRCLDDERVCPEPTGVWKKFQRPTTVIGAGLKCRQVCRTALEQRLHTQRMKMTFLNVFMWRPRPCVGQRRGDGSGRQRHPSHHRELGERLPVDAIPRGDTAGLGLVALIVAGVGLAVGFRSLLIAFRL